MWDPLFSKGKKCLKAISLPYFCYHQNTHCPWGLADESQVMSLNVIGSSCCLLFQLPLRLWMACGQILGHEMEMEVCWRWWGEMGSFVKVLPFLKEKRAGVSFSLPHTFELPA